MRPNTGIDVLNSASPSFIKIVSQMGKDGELACQAILTILINELLNFFNVGKSMSQDQVAATINLILEDYSSLKPDDFKLCFKRAMRGHYKENGKSAMYDRIDGELIFEWLEKYLYEKETEIEAHRSNENVRLKKESNFKLSEIPATIDIEHEEIEDKNKPVPMPEWFKLPKKEMKPSKPQKASEQQMLLNDLINQFNAIHRHRTINNYPNCIGKHGKFIKRAGKLMNLDEFLYHKSQQVLSVNKYLYKRRYNRLKPYLEFRKKRDGKRRAA